MSSVSGRKYRMLRDFLALNAGFDDDDIYESRKYRKKGQMGWRISSKS